MMGKIVNYTRSGQAIYSIAELTPSQHQQMLFDNVEAHCECHSLVAVLADATNALVRHKD